MVLLERRIGLLFGLFLALLVLAGARAMWLAGVRGSDLSRRATTQQTQELTIRARRGAITDRNGVELAVSEDAATVFADPKQIRHALPVARRIAPVLGRPLSDVLKELSDTRRDSALR